jgi:hypothetical protein
MKQTIFLCVWTALRYGNNEFARLYESLVPRKCVYDERKRPYIGKTKVIGWITGQLITVFFTLLKRDQEVLVQGGMPPKPELHDPAIHHSHRAGQYHSRMPEKAGNVVQLPAY